MSASVTRRIQRRMTPRIFGRIRGVPHKERKILERKRAEEYSKYLKSKQFNDR